MIQLEWKSYNISLAKVEEWMRANCGEHYCGNQATTCLELWFTEEPGEAVRTAIATYWDEMTDQSVEAAAYFSQAAATAAEKAAREDMVTKSFDQLSTQQKKILAQVALTNSDYQTLISVYS
jgi:hypothetical protein